MAGWTSADSTVWGFFFFFFLFVSDIDECKVYGMCSQDCQNTKGSYKCLCKAGYQLEPDKKTCKAKGNFFTCDFPLCSDEQ